MESVLNHWRSERNLTQQIMVEQANMIHYRHMAAQAKAEGASMATYHYTQRAREYEEGLQWLRQQREILREGSAYESL